MTGPSAVQGGNEVENQTELLILVLVLGGLMLLWRERHRVFPGNWSSAALKRGNDWGAGPPRQTKTHKAAVRTNAKPELQRRRRGTLRLARHEADGSPYRADFTKCVWRRKRPHSEGLVYPIRPKGQHE